MRDKRHPSEYSVEELERMLAIRRRQERQKRLTRLASQGRVVTVALPESKPQPKAQPKTQPPEAVSPSQRVFAVPPKPKVSAISTDSFTLDTLESMLQGRSSAPSLPTQAPAASSAVVNGDMAHEEDFDDTQTDPAHFQGEDAAEKKPAGRKVFDRLLLLIEVAAVAVLVVIVALAFTEMNNLQRESALVQAEGEAQRLAGMPTQQATSVIQLAKLEDYVLPGGHLIDDSGRAVLNINEIVEAVPSHLQASVVNQAYSIDFVRPPQTAETALQVFIPDLDVDATIVQGTDWEALKLGVGQVLNGANPTDDTTNVALAAHNDVYGALFENLDQLKEGAVIQLQTENQLFNYYVTHWEIVKPNEVNVLDSQGVPMVTLISCYSYLNSERYIVYAVREDAYRSSL